MAGALKYVRESSNFVGFEGFIDNYKPTKEELALIVSICEDMGSTVAIDASIPPTFDTPFMPKNRNRYTRRNEKRGSGPDSLVNGGIVRRHVVEGKQVNNK